MRSRKPEMNMANMIWETEMSKDRVEDTLKRADAIRDDVRREDRIKAQQCKACFYFSRIGGAAITTQACMSCGDDQQYGSTATDKLCMSCAKDGDLCKRCGGDIDLRVRRRKWPEPKV